MINLEIKIKRLDQDLELPSFAYEGDAAFDMRSREDIIIAPGEMKLIKTGLAMAIPKGFRGIIKDRSGLAAKHGLETSAGVIDAGYRGEIGIVMRNHGRAEFAVEKGMRIAQMKIEEVPAMSIVEVDDLDDSHRGEGGFGSSGLM